MNLRSLADVPDEFPPTNPVEKPEVGLVDEFRDGGRGIVHEPSETRMDRRGPGGPWADDSAAVAHLVRNVPDSSTAVPAINVNLLALDLGTHTGYAVRRRDGTVIHGTENFTPRASWSPGQRWTRFRSWLSVLVVNEQIHHITYERVIFGHSSASASDVYGGFRALVEMVADNHNVALSCVSVPTVKKHFTGSGRADKAAMIVEARRRGFRPVDDNAADALAVLHWAIAQETQR